ncbi:MAG: dipeptidase [Gemmatimonadaceae bacterium]
MLLTIFNRSLRLAVVLACVGVPVAAQSLQKSVQQPDPNLARALRVLRTSPVIDGHNDLPWAVRESKTAPRDVDAYDLSKRTVGRTDLARLRQGMVGGQFWSVYVPGEIRDSGFARVQLEQIDIAKRVIARYPDRLALALTAADVRRDFASGKVASLLGMEGGHAIENSLGALRAYYDLGVRYMTLTHNVTLDWADAALDRPTHAGLTPFGREVVREMNRLGMLVDLSHVSPGTMSTALDATEAPVIFSHSSARALVDSPRDVPDSILKRMRTNGGVVMVTFVPDFVSREYASWQTARSHADSTMRQTAAGDTAAYRASYSTWIAAHPEPAATLAQVADHVEHVRDVAGVDHVGIGGDFDGTGDEKIVGLEDVSTYPALFAELARRGWSDADMRKLADQNVLRALEQAESVARRLQKIRPPSTRTIDELDHATRTVPGAR